MVLLLLRSPLCEHTQRALVSRATLIQVRSLTDIRPSPNAHPIRKLRVVFVGRTWAWAASNIHRCLLRDDGTTSISRPPNRNCVFAYFFLDFFLFFFYSPINYSSSSWYAICFGHAKTKQKNYKKKPSESEMRAEWPKYHGLCSMCWRLGGWIDGRKPFRREWMSLVFCLFRNTRHTQRKINKNVYRSEAMRFSGVINAKHNGQRCDRASIVYNWIGIHLILFA